MADLVDVDPNEQLRQESDDHDSMKKAGFKIDPKRELATTICTTVFSGIFAALFCYFWLFNPDQKPSTAFFRKSNLDPASYGGYAYNCWAYIEKNAAPPPFTGANWGITDSIDGKHQNWYNPKENVWHEITTEMPLNRNFFQANVTRLFELWFACGFFL